MENDERINRGDEETPFFEIVDTAFGEVDAFLDFLDPGGLEAGLGEFDLEVGEFFFLDRQEGIHTLG
jgi:hypothetical protein